MQITKKVTFIAKEDKIKPLKALLETMIIPSREEDGCLLYNIYQVENQPTRFVVVETWENETALDGHKASAHCAHYKSNFEPFTEGKSSENLISLI